MIDKYIDEFYNSPQNISQEKITFIKNYFYPEINQYRTIKRENFQVGVNSNRNLLFFRDKNNKYHEVILYLNTNKKFSNFRKNISSTIYFTNSFDINIKNQKTYTQISNNTNINSENLLIINKKPKYDYDDVDNQNYTSIKNCTNKCNCNIF